MGRSFDFITAEAKRIEAVLKAHTAHKLILMSYTAFVKKLQPI